MSFCKFFGRQSCGKSVGNESIDYTCNYAQDGSARSNEVLSNSNRQAAVSTSRERADVEKQLY